MTTGAELSAVAASDVAVVGAGAIGTRRTEVRTSGSGKRAASGQAHPAGLKHLEHEWKAGARAGREYPVIRLVLREAEASGAVDEHRGTAGRQVDPAPLDLVHWFVK
jgi:hypothetical protein